MESLWSDRSMDSQEGSKITLWESRKKDEYTYSSYTYLPFPLSEGQDGKGPGECWMSSFSFPAVVIREKERRPDVHFSSHSHRSRSEKNRWFSFISFSVYEYAVISGFSFELLSELCTLLEGEREVHSWIDEHARCETNFLSPFYATERENFSISGEWGRPINPSFHQNKWGNHTCSAKEWEEVIHAKRGRKVLREQRF